MKLSDLKEEIHGQKISTTDFIRKLLMTILGCFFVAGTVFFFLRPNQMISGGITGISILLEHITGVPLSLLIILLNIPTLMASFFLLKKDFTFFSACSIFLISGYLSLFEHLGLHGVSMTDDVVLACVFGGVINGIGSGLMFRNGTSAGGLDIVGAIVKKYYNISLGNVLMGLNLVVISISGFVFTPNRAMYTLIALFITYTVIDRIQTGVGRQKQVFIVSKKYEEITEALHAEMERGATFLTGKGTFSMYEMKIIYMVCSSVELVKVRNIVKMIDPDAFLTVNDTSEIMGGGFREMEI